MFQLSANARLSCLLAGAMLLLGACAETPNPAPELVAATPTQPPQQTQQNPAQAQAAAPVAPALNFADWRAGFRAKALQAGIQPQVFDQAFAGVTPDLSVVKADGAQPEFTRPVWEYLDGAISPLRVRKGQALLAEHAATLDAIEQRYGVDRETLVAIWGMESSFGQFMGEQSVIRSLATLAYEGRRPRFAEDQLLAALQILQSGDISSSGLRGSWAGAMGQTQFIPTTYLTHAVDFDGDGRRDIWNSSADALASAAHYLQASGWQKGRAWGIQVALPSGFDYALADTEVRKTYAQWYAHGVKGTPTNVDPSDTGYLLLPAGHRGPAFLVFRNFGAILKYNNSSSYALAVSLLGHRLRGGGPFATPWPTDDAGLSRAERREVQTLLAARGHAIGAIDGMLGDASRAAIRIEQQRLGHAVDGRAGQKLLKALKENH